MHRSGGKSYLGAAIQGILIYLVLRETNDMYATARSKIKHAISRTASISVVVIVIIIIVIGAYAALALGSTSTTTTTTAAPPTTSATSSSSSSSTTSSSSLPISSTTSTTSSTSSSSGGPSAIRIGILEPLTGFASEYGITEMQAAQFTASEINSAGGINGKQIEIFSADEGSGGTQTINAFNELVLQDHVNFIIGTDFSGDLEAILPLIVKYHVITMSLSNSLVALHNLIGTNNATSYNMYKYYFTLVYNDTYEGVVGVDDFAVPLHASSVFITGEDYLYAHEVGSGSASEAQAKGITVAGQTYFPGDQLDFTSEVLNIASLKPSVIILITSGSDTETFVKQLKQNPQTENIPVIDVSTGDFLDPNIVANLRAQGTNLNYVSQLGCYYPMNFSSQTPVFVQKWKTAYGVYPNLYTEGTTYDAIHIFARAVNMTGGNLNSDGLVSAIENMTYSGITGVIKFNSQNAVSYPPYILPQYEFTNQTTVIYWPKQVANGTYVPPPGYTWTPPSS